jgi:hypothetical protein
MIAIERQPRDPSWADLCAQEQIVLVWPGNMAAVAARPE